MAKTIMAVALVAIAEFGIQCGELVQGTPGQIKALGENVDAGKGAVTHRVTEGVRVVKLPEDAPASELNGEKASVPGDTALFPEGEGSPQGNDGATQ